MIDFPNFSQLESLLGKACRFLIESKQQHPGGWPVQPVNRENALAQLIAKPFKGDPFGALGIPARMDNHPRGLVHRDEMFILVE
jgi:hypothetical protein